MSAEIKQLAPREDSLPVAAESVSPLAAMLSSGQHDVESIERLWQIQQQWEAGEARKAYYAAMALVRSELPEVQRTGKNAHLKSTYATLDDIIATIGSVLGKHGLSVAWSQSQPEGKVTASCTVTHQLGHSESSEFTVPVDGSNKGVNVAQAHGIASTYARRYALTALLGISTSDDADAHLPPPAVPMADEDAVAKIIDMLAAAEDAVPGTDNRWRKAYGPKYQPAENDLGMAIPAAHVDGIVKALGKKISDAKELGE